MHTHIVASHELLNSDLPIFLELERAGTIRIELDCWFASKRKDTENFTWFLKAINKKIRPGLKNGLLLSLKQ